MLIIWPAEELSYKFIIILECFTVQEIKQPSIYE